MIDVVNRQRLISIDRKSAAQLAVAVLEAVDHPSGNSGEAMLAVAFVRDREIERLNSEFRGKKSPTDVLSFTAGDRAGFLGDVVISTDAVLRQASEAGHSIDREVSELIIHGVLHLCGFDHETDGGLMNRIELKLRRKLLGH